MYRLTQLLGDVQDISIIKQECCSGTGHLKGQTVLLDHLQTKQNALKQNAITLAESIEIKDPQVFVKQLERYWVEFLNNQSSFGLPARSKESR